MQCPICGRRDFEGSASSIIHPPNTPARGTSLGLVKVTVEMIYTCRSCGQQMTGNTTVTVACHLTDKAIPFPADVFRQASDDYGAGWELRVQGRRVKSDASPSMKAGWRDANQHSIDRGGKPPPKGWGYTKGRSCYLKTKEGLDHMKLICLDRLRD